MHVGRRASPRLIGPVIGWRDGVQTIDSARGELPDEHRPHLQGEARIPRFVSPFGERPAVFAVHFAPAPARRVALHGATPDSSMTHLTVQVTEPGDIDWDVDQGDLAVDY